MNLKALKLCIQCPAIYFKRTVGSSQRLGCQTPSIPRKENAHPFQIKRRPSAHPAGPIYR